MGEFRPLWSMIQVGWGDATVTPWAAHRFIRDGRLKVYATRSGYQFDFYHTPSRRIIQIEKIKHKRQQDLCMCKPPGDPGHRVANLNEDEDRDCFIYWNAMAKCAKC